MPQTFTPSGEFKLHTDESNIVQQTRSSGGLFCWPRFCFGSRSSSSKIPLNQTDMRAGGTSSAIASIRALSSTENAEDESVDLSRTKSKGGTQSSINQKTLMGNLHLIDSVSYTKAKPATGSIRNRVNEDAFLLESRELRDGLKVSLFGVFDGHVNEQLSHWLSENYAIVFYKVLEILQHSYGLADCLVYTKRLFPSSDSYTARSKRLYALNCPDFITLAICTSFAICDERAMSLGSIDTVNSGSCASIVVVTNSGVFMATVGDSSVALVLAADGAADGTTENRRRRRVVQTLFKTSDHRAICRPDEIDRVLKSGGKVHKGRSVGMEFSSIGVTRSLGDTIWRANDDWKRDRTSDAGIAAAGSTGAPSAPSGPSGPRLAVDEELLEFSRMKGCVGVSSDPEWYSCFFGPPSAGRDGGGRISFKSNSPESALRHQDILCLKSSEFFIIAGSDGFWETSGISGMMTHLEEDHGASSEGLIGIAKKAIGHTPHDDATVIVAKLGFVGKCPGSESDDETPHSLVVDDDSSSLLTDRKRSQSDNNHHEVFHGHLDYLFR